MKRHLRFSVGALAMVLVACADRPGPVLTAVPHGDVQRALAPDGYEAPVFENASSVPPEYAWAEVISHQERVSWSGNQASGYGSMVYFGNRGRIELEIQILHRYSTVATTRTEREQPYFFPAEYRMGIPLPYTVPESCGQTANLRARYSARTVFWVQTAITEIGPDIKTGFDDATQPSCPEPDPGGTCGGSEPIDYMTSLIPASPGANASPDGYLYDPYDPGYATPAGCPGGSGDPDSGGQTFPEMCSSLGGKLYYDYGCFEAYDASSGEWETVWCGTVAVCET